MRKKEPKKIGAESLFLMMHKNYLAREGYCVEHNILTVMRLLADIPVERRFYLRRQDAEDRLALFRKMDADLWNQVIVLSLDELLDIGKEQMRAMDTVLEKAREERK